MATRIGIFGGAFDPPHDAHVALARAAIAQLQLDRLQVLPTGSAWHKERTLSPAADRLAMAQAAFGDIEHVVVDDREMRRAGPSFTIDTLHALQAENPGADFFLLLGGDQAAALPTWHRWKALLHGVTVGIARRPGTDFDTGEPAWHDEPGARWRWVDMPALALSATDIRARAARGEDLHPLVPTGVARYIDRHHLYRTAR